MSRQLRGKVPPRGSTRKGVVPRKRKPKDATVLCCTFANPRKVLSCYPKDFPYAQKMIRKMFPKDLGPKGDSVIYFLNRKEYDKNSKILIFQAYVYKVNGESNNWEQIVGEHEQTRLSVEFQPLEKSKRLKDKPFAHVVVKETWNNEVLFSLFIDKNNEFTLLDENYQETGETFLSIFSHTNENYGFVMNPDDSKQLQHRMHALTLESEKKTTKGKNMHPFFVCVGLIGMVPHNEDDENVDEKTHLRSLAVCTKKVFAHLLYPLMKHTLDELLNNPNGTAEILRNFYRSVNSVSIPQQKLTSIHKKVQRWTIADSETTNFSTSVDLFGKKFPLKVNLCLFRDELGDEKLSIMKLLIKFKEETMTIFNAMFQERKIMFFSKKRSISEIARAIFSAVLMVAPPLTGLLEYRVFPYCTTNNLSFADVDGYIAGVNEEVFESRQDIWDIFCNLDTGQVLKNPKVYTEGFRPPYEQLDSKFCQVLRDMIHYHIIGKLQREYTDHCLRSHFYTYTNDLIRMAIGKTQDTGGVIKNSIETNFSRVENWKKTYSYSFYLKKLQFEKKQSRIDENFNLDKSITLLRIGKNITDDVILKMLKNFAKLKKKEQFIEFLSYFPLAQGGLYPIAALLLHRSKFVRFKIASFLNRIEQTKEGYIAIAQLNMFLQLTYDRTIKQIQNRQKK